MLGVRIKGMGLVIACGVWNHLACLGGDARADTQIYLHWRCLVNIEAPTTPSSLS